MPCPSKTCRAGGPIQRQLSANEIETIGKPNWASTAERCNYCGCVHTFESGLGQVQRGWLDAPMLEQGWIPIKV